MLNKQKIYTCLGYVYKDSWKIYAYTVVAFMVRDIKSLNCIFSIFSLPGFIKLMMKLKISQRILKHVLYMSGTLFFVLIPRYCCE